MGISRMVGPSTQFLDLETLNDALDLCECILNKEDYSYDDANNQIHFSDKDAEYRFSVAWSIRSW